VLRLYLFFNGNPYLSTNGSTPHTQTYRFPFPGENSMDPIGEFLRNPLIALCFLLLGAIFGWILEMFLFEPFFGQRGRQRENEWRTKFAHADSTRGRLEIQLGEAQAELDALRGQVADSDQRLSRLTADLRAAHEARASLDADLAGLRAQLADRESQLAALNADLSAGAEARAKLEAELADLRAQLSDREQKIAALTADLNASADARAKLDADLTEKLGLLAGATALTASLRGDVDIHRSRAAAAEAELGEWKLRADSAEAELAQLRTQLAERINLHHHTEAELAALRADLLAKQRQSGASDIELGDWRLRAEGAETELANLRAQLAESSARYTTDLEGWRLRAEGAETELANLRAQLAESSARYTTDLEGWRLRAEGAETELANLRAQLAESSARYTTDLEGWRLRAEGAETELANLRAQLAAAANLQNELTAARSELSDLRLEIGQKAEQLISLERELAQVRADYAALQAHGAGGVIAAGAAGVAVAGLAASGEASRAERAEREAANLRAQLAERVHTLHLTEVELARLRTEVIEARNAAAEMEDELADVIAAPTRAAPHLNVLAAGAAEHDDLILINGIGPVFEKRLKEAGITNFAQLADTPDERLIEIVRAKKWQAVDASFWRRQAREFAEQKRAGIWSVGAGQGDNLTAINGIGPMFERRLKNAGITTFAQLAETPSERLLEIVRAKSWQVVDPEFWRRQAREFAAGRPE